METPGGKSSNESTPAKTHSSIERFLSFWVSFDLHTADGGALEQVVDELDLLQHYITSRLESNNDSDLDSDDETMTSPTSSSSTATTTSCTAIKNLGRIGNDDVGRLLTSLTALMNHRSVDVAEEAADADAAEAILIPTMTTLKVSPVAYLAGSIYSRLVSTSGSYGAGFVDAAALSSLVALMRRWSRENDTEKDRADASEPSSSKSNSKSKSNKRKAPTRRGGKKRARRSVASNFSDSDSDYDANNDEEDNLIKTPKTTTSKSLPSCLSGANIASILSNVCTIGDFTSFSDETSELIVEICTISLASSSAILTLGKRLTSKETSSLTSLLPQLNSSLLSAVSSTSLTLRRRHTMAVFLLRGLLPILSLQVEVSNGQKGKLGGEFCLFELELELELR